jgi:hypothetical protein
MVEEGAALPAATIDVNGGSIQRPLAEVCAEVAEKVNSFLESEVEGQVLKDVQAQTRIALGVIEECLERYRYVNYTVQECWEGTTVVWIHVLIQKKIV